MQKSTNRKNGNKSILVLGFRPHRYIHFRIIEPSVHGSEFKVKLDIYGVRKSAPPFFLA